MTTSPPDGAVVEVEALAEALVAAVIRPEDADQARATIDRVGPTDLAALVAVVDDHQPMTIEVVVDVLAELGCAPATIADAVAADLDDVHVLLGIDPSPPPSSLEDGPRVIDLGGMPPGVGGPLATSQGDRDEEPGVEDGGTDDTTGAEEEPRNGVDGGVDDAVPDDEPLGHDDHSTVVVIGGADDASEAATSDVDVPGPATVGEPGRSTPDTTSDGDASVSPAAGGARRRAIWALVSFVVLVGAFLALAAYLGAFG